MNTELYAHPTDRIRKLFLVMMEDSYVGGEAAAATTDSPTAVPDIGTTTSTTSTKTKAAKTAASKRSTAAVEAEKAKQPTKLSKFIQQWICFMAFVRCSETGKAMTKQKQEEWQMEAYTDIAKEFIKRASDGKWTGSLFSVFSETETFKDVTIDQLLKAKGDGDITGQGVMTRGTAIRKEVRYRCMLYVLIFI